MFFHLDQKQQEISQNFDISANCFLETRNFRNFFQTL